MANQAFSGLQAAFDAKAQNSAIAMREVFLGQRMLWVTLQSRIADPTDSGMRLQELRHAQRVLAMPLHAQRQRLQTLQEQPGVEGRGSRADVTQKLHTSL